MEHVQKSHGPIRVIRPEEKDPILQACHSAPTGGNLRINKTCSTITSRYYWGTQYKDVADFIGKPYFSPQLGYKNLTPLR